MSDEGGSPRRATRTVWIALMCASVYGCSSSGDAGAGPDAGGADAAAATGSDAGTSSDDGGSLPTTDAASSLTDVGGETGSDGASADAGSDATDAGPSGVPMYIATGYQNRRIVSFDDATSWVNDVSNPPDSLDDIGTGVAFGGGTVVVAGHTGIYTSTNGKDWTHLPAPVPQVWPGLGGAAAVYGDGKFVIVAGNDAWVSTDGSTFTAHTPSSDMSATHWSGIAYGNGHYFAVGDSNGPANRKVSEDGVAWHDYVADDSVDGLTWTGVAFGNGVFVAVAGNQGGKTDLTRRVWTTDGVTLHDVTDDTLGGLLGVAYGSGKFVTWGYDGVATSVDGKTWVKASAASGPSGSAFGSGLFLATQWESQIWSSADGASDWKKVFEGAAGSPALARVAFGYVRSK
jgi:hypothetical protein